MLQNKGFSTFNWHILIELQTKHDFLKMYIAVSRQIVTKMHTKHKVHSNRLVLRGDNWMLLAHRP